MTSSRARHPLAGPLNIVAATRRSRPRAREHRPAFCRRARRSRAGSVSRSPVGAGIEPSPCCAPSPRPLVPGQARFVRHRIQLTVWREVHVWLRRVEALLRHALPPGDAAEIFDCALRLLTEDLERRRAAQVTDPRAANSRDTTDGPRGCAHPRNSFRDRRASCARHPVGTGWTPGHDGASICACAAWLLRALPPPYRSPGLGSCSVGQWSSGSRAFSCSPCACAGRTFVT